MGLPPRDIAALPRFGCRGRTSLRRSHTAPEDCIVPGYLGSRAQVLKRQGQLNFQHDAWDWSIYGPKILQDPDGTYRMYYAGYDDAGYTEYRVCMATTQDFKTWVKPNIGLYSHNGSTNNNIVLKLDPYITMQFLDCTIDPNTGKYIMVIRVDETGANILYESSDGGVAVPFTDINQVPLYTGEHCIITWNPLVSKYRRWYRNNGNIERRSIGYFDSASLTGPWVDRGFLPVFTSTDANVQFYDLTAFYYAGSMWGAVNMYSLTTPYDTLATMRLYRSEDHGDTWTRSTDLLRQSPVGSWDRGLTTDGCPVLCNGVWYYIYGGKTGVHWTISGPTSQITFGLATAIQNPTAILVPPNF